MMRSSLTLRSRFLFAMLAVVLLLCVTFGLTVHRFIEILEDELLHQTLVREMQDFARDYSVNPQTMPPSTGELSGYIVQRGQVAADLPQALRNLATGFHEDIVINDRNYYVARQDVSGSALYLLLDTERVETIETEVTTVAVISGLIAVALAALLAMMLTRTVMRPVTALATNVAELAPGRRGLRLRGTFADREIGVIATAFDDYLARLDQVLEREQAFTEDASHELRTPLSIIDSAAQLLDEEKQLSTQGRERLVRIRRACGQMQSLIDALLFLAREQNAGAAQPCALDEIVSEAADIARSMTAGKNISIDVQVEPVTVTAPPGMAASVVNNLVLNAVNFTQQGLIEIRLASTGLTVRDTGAGIAPTDLAHIFERRYRGMQSRGLGLGLYLVSRMCQHLGWHIEADSTQGMGTSFVITFSAAGNSDA